MKQSYLILLIILLSFFSVKSQPTSNDSRAELNKMNLDVVKLFKENNFNEALPIAKKAVEFAEKQFGEKSIETGLALSNLGYIQNLLKDERSGENSFERSTKILKKISNLEKHNEELLAEMLEHLAIKKQKKDFLYAESEVEEAILWREKASGQNAKQLVGTYFLLANISYWKKEYKKSADRYYKVLELAEQNRNINNEEAKMAYYRCRCSFIKAGKEDELTGLKQRFEMNSNSIVATDLSGNVGTILNGKALNLVRPPYPQEAKAERAQGTVNVEILIGKNGKVLSACGSNKVHPALIESSEVAALNSTFSPTTIGGNPVNVTGRIVYNFSAR